jgi:hypothetical protein
MDSAAKGERPPPLPDSACRSRSMWPLVLLRHYLRSRLDYCIPSGNRAEKI